jgi:hypothetical protein
MQNFNVVFVATNGNQVYAFNADTPSSMPLWHTNFTNPAQGITTVPTAVAMNCGDLRPEYGILGTPVIDLARRVMYFVTSTMESGTVVFRW